MIKKILLVLAILVGVALAKPDRHPDVGLSIKQLVPKYGYPFEEHTVTTKDGYILELHRIPHGKRENNHAKKAVVLVLPGMLSCSDSWINMGPDAGLGYILADSGYDVWIGNHRGTTWSRKHTTLNTGTGGEEFWNFSYHEMGVYDNPAFIDYILDHTNQTKLFYVGHSQGSTSFFAMTSELPEYNKKIRLMVGLGSAMYTNRLKSPLIRFLIPFRDRIWDYLEEMEIYGVMMHSKLFTLAGEIFCSDGSLTQGLCITFISLISGFNRSQTNKVMLPVIASSSPSGASWKQFSHYVQGYYTGDFRQYDYGRIENLEKYGQDQPPKYKLNQITSPVALYYGNNDYLTILENSLRIKRALPNVVYSKLVKNFNHLDFMWAKDVATLLYYDVLKLMKNY